MAIWIALKKGWVDESFFKNLKLISRETCRRCQKVPEEINFVSKTGHDVFLLCKYFRQQDLCLTASEFYKRVSMNIVKSPDISSARLMVHSVNSMTKTEEDLNVIGYNDR